MPGRRNFANRSGRGRAVDCEPLEPRRLFAASVTQNLGVLLPADFSSASVGDVLYFSGRTAGDGSELWRSDGTLAGTSLVKSIYQGANSSSPSGLAAVDGVLYFLATDSAGRALWRSDGTPTGTTPVARFSSISDLTPVGNRLFFVANDGNGAGQELWVSDGTAAGTHIAADINPGPDGTLIRAVTAFDGRAFFRAESGAGTPGATGAEPWLSDGTPAGTRMLRDINPGEFGSTDPALVSDERGWVAGGRLYFGATDRVHGYDLWSTDGTDDGTRLAADLRPGGNNSNPHPAAVVGDALYSFTGSTPPHELWKTDTVSGETTQVGIVSDDATGNFASQPLYSTPLPGGRFVFGSGNTASGYELWLSDGTPAGTGLLTEVNPGPDAGVERAVRPATLDGTVYFSGSDGASGWEPWGTDGTAAGTRRVADVAPGAAGSRPSQLAAAGEKLFFAANPSAQPTEGPGTLWVLKPETASISGTVFLDVNADGVKDPGDPLRSDFTPYLDLNNDGMFERLTEPRATVSRQTMGLYTFADLRPGTYTVRLGPSVPGHPETPEPQTLPGQVAVTFPGGGGGNAGYVITVAGSDAVAGKDFGYAGPPSTVDGVVFDDANDNGKRDAGEVALPARTVYLDGDGDGALDPDERRILTSSSGFYSFGLPPGTYTVREVLPAGWSQSTPAGGAGKSITVAPGETARARADFGAYRVPPAAVVGRYVFYNGSSFDGADPAANPADDGAVATDKAALLPGQAPTFANVTTYEKGINGVMIDVANLPAGAALTAADFDFGDASPPLSVTVRRGAGPNGGDRVTLVWREYDRVDGAPVGSAVGNGWLTVTVKANANTGLAQPDVFRFGNLVAETGDGSGATGWRVNAQDLAAVKRALNAASPVDSRTDFNRDGRTNAQDLAAVKRALNRSLPPYTVPPSVFAASQPVPSRRAATRRVVEGLFS